MVAEGNKNAIKQSVFCFFFEDSARPFNSYCESNIVYSKLIYEQFNDIHERIC